MAEKFLELLVTPSVARAQENYYGHAMNVHADNPRDALTLDEQHFIATRDSFYMATVSESGWPYMQHRGGKPGFLCVVNQTTLAFADYNGP
jgi:predicted pyridoxine 5'-phosphate oxidase superfamily flavin-nucleotide-binding protein